MRDLLVDCDLAVYRCQCFVASVEAQPLFHRVTRSLPSCYHVHRSQLPSSRKAAIEWTSGGRQEKFLDSFPRPGHSIAQCVWEQGSGAQWEQGNATGSPRANTLS